MRRIGLAVLAVALMAGAAWAGSMGVNEAAPAEWAVAIYAQGSAADEVKIDTGSKAIMEIIGAGSMGRAAGASWQQATVGEGQGRGQDGGGEGGGDDGGNPEWTFLVPDEDGFAWLDSSSSLISVYCDNDFVIDDDGNIWTSDSLEGGLVWYDQNGDKHFTGVTLSEPLSMAVGPDGKIWISDISYDEEGEEIYSLVCYDPDTGIASNYPGVQPDGMMHPDSQGRIWYIDFVENAVACFDPASGQVTILPGVNSPRYLEMNDAGTALFFSNSAGYSCYDIQGQNIVTGATKSNSTPVIDQNGNAYFVNWGLYYFDKSSGATSLIPDTTNTHCQPAMDALGKVWFTEEVAWDNYRLACYDPATGGITRFEGTNLIISAVVPSPDGKIWFTEHYNDLCCFDPASGEMINTGKSVASGYRPRIDETGDHLWFVDPSKRIEAWVKP